MNAAQQMGGKCTVSNMAASVSRTKVAWFPEPRRFTGRTRGQKNNEFGLAKVDRFVLGRIERAVLMKKHPDAVFVSIHAMLFLAEVLT